MDGDGDEGNELFVLDANGTLLSGVEFDFESNASTFSIRVRVEDQNNGSLEGMFLVRLLDVVENLPPTDLNSFSFLFIEENQPVGTDVGEFVANDPDEDILRFSLVSGDGDKDNQFFALDTNGTLRTLAVFDFERNASSFSLRVRVEDDDNASIEDVFTVILVDVPQDEMKLESSNFSSNGKAGLIAQLLFVGGEEDELRFQLAPSPKEAMHYFTLDANSLKLEENILESEDFSLNVLLMQGNNLILQEEVIVSVSAPQREPVKNANTSDPAYHESALMIRELEVVRNNWRNGHNPIVAIEDKIEGLFVTTAQPHGRKVGDSVVLSGVMGLQIEGVKNWNFMIDEVTEHSFRLLKFGKNADGVFDGSLGPLARAQIGTEYEPSKGDFLLGQWTFGHLLGNMVSEEDDPIDFYRHFASQWNHEQVVNGWETDVRKNTHRALVPSEKKLTLANLPFRLLAIGNRIDLFHAQSMRKVDDAGEGRFVFTMTEPFDLPDEEVDIWKINEKTADIQFFTLIFEFGQPADDFATLAKWAKDWHGLQRDKNSTGFDFDDHYFQQLNDLTDRFSKRGADAGKPNGNPINQVRTNDFINSPLWQMREFNLSGKLTAHESSRLPERETKLKVDASLDSIDIGLWTTTTKNNPMVGSHKVEESIERPLARWINQRESHILDGNVGPRAPEWMEEQLPISLSDFPIRKTLDFLGQESIWLDTNIAFPPVVVAIMGILILPFKWFVQEVKTMRHFSQVSW